ncbi:MAG: hypothetical protein ABSC62_15085 [Terracidiphilus sp.]
MADEMDEKDLAGRVRLIESMIAEGRCRQESWGWTFVLWGVAYYIAFFWSWLGRFAYAWPVAMLAAAVLTGLIFRRRRGRNPETTMGRAIGSIWTAMGLSMFIVLCAMGYSGRFFNGHAMIAVFAGMVGLANAACSMTLRWKAQFFCALLWWAAAVVACYCSDALLLPVFLVAVFFGQIVFGGGMMIAEMRRRKQSEAIHA